MHVLVIEGPGNVLPAGTTKLLGDIGWQVTTAPSYEAAAERARRGGIEAVILSAPRGESPQFQEFVHLLESKRTAAILVGDRCGAAAQKGAFVSVVDPQIPLAELRGQLTMIERYHGQLRRLEGELHNMERLSQRLHDHFREVDEELRLAARLQRDFLPDLSRPFGNLRASAIYRPASWVSGDMFDVFRIDDEHTGLYIVDAVGHGMAASLLTMFIKRAIVPAHRSGDQSVVAEPSQVMSALNDALAEQSLPNCQFVTACYGLFHHPTRRFRCARGGHPYPLLVSPEGMVRELQACGGLLGVAKGQEFASFETMLSPGDKIVVHTDGVEAHFAGASPGSGAFHAVLAKHAAQPIDELIAQVETRLNSGGAFGDLRDDLTILGLEVLPL
jgi:sigma-B regulation protein RsbU (phosphoserine phosphatase)